MKEPITAVLLLIVLILISNVFFTNFDMMELDRLRQSERIRLSATLVEIGKENTTCLWIENEGSVSVHLVSLWIISYFFKDSFYNSSHVRRDLNILLNSGERTFLTPYSKGMISYFFDVIPKEDTLFKIVTERGTISILRLRP